MTRRLSPNEVAAALREVEREQRVRFPRNTKVVFTDRMKHDKDFASFNADLDGRGKMRTLRVRVFGGTDPRAQRIELKHELREAAGVIKGKTVSQAHRVAERAEKGDLRRSGLRRKDGKPYKNTVDAIRAHMRPGGEGVIGAWSTIWRAIKRGLGL